MNPRPRGSYGPGTVYAGHKTRRGLFWELVFTDVAGKRRRKRHYGSRRTAQLELVQIVAERDAVLLGDVKQHTPTMPFGEVVRRFMEDLRPRVSKRHAEETEAGLLRLQSEMALRQFGDLRLPAVAAYRERRIGRTPRPSNRTVNLELAYLRALCNWMVQTGQISSSPLAGYRGLPQGRGHKKTKRALTEREIGKLLAALREEDTRRPNRFPLELITLGLLLTGARYGAFRALTRADWSSSDSLLTIADEITKTGQGRQLKANSPQAGGLHSVIQRSLEAGARILGRLPRPEDPIWLWQRGLNMPSKSRALNGALDRALVAANIPRRTAQGTFSVHALRHTCVTRFARFGVTLPRAQYWVGHASLSMTQGVYTHIESGDLKHATDGIVPEFSAGFLPANPATHEERGQI